MTDPRIVEAQEITSLYLQGRISRSGFNIRMRRLFNADVERPMTDPRGTGEAARLRMARAVPRVGMLRRRR